MNKKIKLKNYTSSMPSEKSIMLIEKKLVEIGASHIAKSYEDSRLSGIMFQIQNKDRPLTFKLPANIGVVTEMMLSEIRRPRQNTKRRIEEQAERTAWRLVLDWVEVQVSMILIGRREITEVFLPYLYDFKKDETLYQKLVSSNFKMLMPPEEK